MADRAGVLIVDVDSEHLRHCRAVLEGLGFRVFAASSAEAALMVGHGEQLLDLALIAADLGDGVTGTDVRQSLENLGRTKRILLMSDEATNHVDHIVKPITAEQLRPMLD
ncbi:response regulator [Sphingobium bisphenolivorans]|uniref:response regulator n=1 Tax=Sphingobium bisphenolivorans TaxID=1335760 RepID=UPI00039B465A|nr:response regulator [Sphingobium bisphenolivorans]